MKCSSVYDFHNVRTNTQLIVSTPKITTKREREKKKEKNEIHHRRKINSKL